MNNLSFEDVLNLVDQDSQPELFHFIKSKVFLFNKYCLIFNLHYFFISK